GPAAGCGLPDCQLENAAARIRVARRRHHQSQTRTRRGAQSRATVAPRDVSAAPTGLAATGDDGPGGAIVHRRPGPGRSGTRFLVGDAAGRNAERAMNPTEFLLISAVRVYRCVLSSAKTVLFGPMGRCRFTPSCSQYALDTIQRHVALRGCSLSV